MAVLDDVYTEQQLAIELDRKVSTLKRWRREGKGPPFGHIGQTVVYHKAAVAQWVGMLLGQAIDKARPRRAAQ